MGRCERFANCSDVSKARTLHIAFLNCDQPGEEVKRQHGGFDEIMHTLLEPVLAEAQDEISLVVDGYDVVSEMEYPDDFEPLDAIIVSGSCAYCSCAVSHRPVEADAHEDLPWITKMLEFVRRVHREHERIRLIGAISLMRFADQRHLLGPSDHRASLRSRRRAESGWMGGRSDHPAPHERRQGAAQPDRLA